MVEQRWARLQYVWINEEPECRKRKKRSIMNNRLRDVNLILMPMPACKRLRGYDTPYECDANHLGTTTLFINGILRIRVLLLEDRMTIIAI